MRARNWPGTVRPGSPDPRLRAAAEAYFVLTPKEPVAGEDTPVLRVLAEIEHLVRVEWPRGRPLCAAGRSPTPRPVALRCSAALTSQVRAP